MAEMWQVDVFAGPGCSGNRAAVLLLDAPLSDSQMQAIAADLACPATAFVQRVAADGAHDTRWFYRAGEISLCGHGALAAGHVLHGVGDTGDLRLRTADGRELALRHNLGDGALEIALPVIASQPCNAADWADVLRAQPAQMRWNAAGYAAAIFDHAQDVRDLAPDFTALAQRGNIQLSVSAPDDVAGQIVSRVFSGGGEDAATGSAHAMIAPYWCERLGVERLIAHQLSPRGGLLQCRVDGDRVWLAGECQIVSGPADYLCG